MTIHNNDGQIQGQGTARKGYYRARADNIKEQVSVYDILNYYDVPIRTENAEVQFPCPLHGDGRDMGFSARAYPEESRGEGSSTYCFGCHKSRDVIEWVKDKETISFIQAMKLIEEVFGVQEIPNIYDFFDPTQMVDSGDGKAPKSQLDNELSEILDKPKNLDQGSIEFVEKKIMRLIANSKEKVSMKAATRLFYAYDSVKFDLENENIEEERALKILTQVMHKVMEFGAAKTESNGDSEEDI